MPARNSARYSPELAQTVGTKKKEPLEIPLNSEGFQLVRLAKYPREDSNESPECIEPATGYGIQGTPPGTKSGTVDARRDALQALVAVWDTLDDATVNRIMRLIQG